MNNISNLLKQTNMQGRDGFYYLHENGDLIFKKELPELDSPFVKRIWPVDVTNRAFAWIMVIESSVLGTRKDRVNSLAQKWGLTDDDAQIFAQVVNMKIFKDGNMWCAVSKDFKNVQESQCGFGPSCLEALIDYAKQGKLNQ